MDVACLSPPDAAVRLLAGAVLVDVRSVGEFSTGHAAGALNVPSYIMRLGGLRPNRDFLRVMLALFPVSQELLLCCNSGHRSLLAHRLLQGAGFERVACIEGGLEGSKGAPGWLACGMPAQDVDPGVTYSALLDRIGPEPQ